MRTTYDAENIIFKTLSASNTLNISGDVYKHRPLNSHQEDIIVGSLPISNDDIQKAVLNINVHVPNLIVNISGAQDNTQPNLARLNELTRLVWQLLDNQFFNGYWFYVQQQNLFADEQTNEHYSNIRLEFYSINTTN